MTLVGAILFLIGVVVVSTWRVDGPQQPPPPHPPTAVEVRLDRMVRSGDCWTWAGLPPYAGHAFFLTPTRGLHYGPSAPAFAIVFGPDGVAGSGDEAAGQVAAFCL